MKAWRDHHSMDESDLIRSAQSDIDAFAPLYERHAPAVYRLCFRAVENADLANDLTAKVFLNAIAKLNSYTDKPGATFRSWLMQIARNEVVDHWRRHRRLVPLYLEIHDRADPSPGPEDIAVHRSELAEVIAALNTLPERYREVIELRLAGLSISEVSATIGLTESAAKSIQTRAFRHLRVELKNGGVS